MHVRNPTEVSFILKAFFRLPLGTGKTQKTGRFRISRSTLRKLTRRCRITDAYIEELVCACQDRGLALINVDDAFLVVGLESLADCRVVTLTDFRKKHGDEYLLTPEVLIEDNELGPRDAEGDID